MLGKHFFEGNRRFEASSPVALDIVMYQRADYGVVPVILGPLINGRERLQIESIPVDQFRTWIDGRRSTVES